MHAIIASTSMGVPTVAIAYSHKTHGIMEILGCSKYVLDIKDLDYNTLASAISDVWNNRIKIRKKLESRWRISNTTLC